MPDRKVAAAADYLDGDGIVEHDRERDAYRLTLLGVQVKAELRRQGWGLE